MENFFVRYKNPLVLMVVLFVQVVALATQVKRPEGGKAANAGGTPLIRVWTVNLMTPFERALSSTGQFFRRNWHNYIDLHNARRQNRELQEEISRMKMEQVRLRQDAEQAQRLQALLGFKERYVGQLVPAQVIGTSGSEQSRVIYIDKGSHAGIRQDMPVITPDGVVGKIKDVFPFSSQVLLMSDRDSGAGVILQSSRLQGILRGSPSGELRISDIMSDEKIDVGEQVVTSGGDRIYPKGLPVGTVTNVAPDRDNDPFLAVRIRPAADLNRLEEVLVVTRIAEQSPDVAGSSTPMRAADILAQRLPTVTKPEEGAAKAANAKPPAGAAPAPNSATGTAPPTQGAPKNPAKPPVPPAVQKKGTAAGQVSVAPVAGTGTPEKAKPPQVKKPKPVATPTPAAADADQPVAQPATTKPEKPEATPRPTPPAADAEKPPR